MNPRFFLLILLSLPFLSRADFTVMAKQHATHKEFESRPYGKDDLSYGIFYEYVEGGAGWRLGAMYGTDLSGAYEADSVITPEITLFLNDGLWETGISVLRDYIDSDTEDGWDKIYYQVHLGLNLPLGPSFSVGAAAFYPMDKLSNITDFSFDDLDYGLLVRLRF